MAVHGLATPGIFLEEYGRNAVIGLAGALAVPSAGVVLALAVYAPPSRPGAQQLIVRAQVVAVLALVAFAVVGLTRPELVPEVPVTLEPWSYALLLPTGLLYLVVARRAYVIHRLTRRAADLWVALGLVWLGSSIVIYLLSSVWSPWFWFAHMLEAMGVVAVAGAVAFDLARQRPSHQLFDTLRGDDLLESEEELLGGYVRALTVSLDELDPSTGAHSRRVAHLAVRVAERMGLEPAAVRRVAIAALVHDIGKLQIDSAILNKPGALDDREFAEIKRHPVIGAELLARLGGFDDEVAIVLGHHERMDGAGYPHGLGPDRIPVEARILSVCDVYDALTNRRVYREAWDADRAVALIRDETGSAFDPRCADALISELNGAGEVRVIRRRLSDPAPIPRTQPG
jgi:putative nucleotidyltransferase with HDIG domain